MSECRPLRVILAKPRGFCAGVVRAIEIVERALAMFGPPVYVRHEIVHNHHVVERLRAMGAVFVDELDEIPTGAQTIFSAHGVSPAVMRRAKERGLDVIDATCPLVERVHREVRRYAERGYEIVLIGHDGHAEVEGTRGQIESPMHVISSKNEVFDLKIADPTRIAYVTQTTLSLLDTKEIIAALKQRFPLAVGPETRDICYATQNRQTAVLTMTHDVQLLLVVGAPNSSNSNRLRELGASAGVASHLIQSAAAIDPNWLDGVDVVGVTAGASAPEILVQETIERLALHRTLTIETLAGDDELVQFRLPTRLVDPPVLAGARVQASEAVDATELRI